MRRDECTRGLVEIFVQTQVKSESLKLVMEPVEAVGAQEALVRSLLGNTVVHGIGKDRAKMWV